MPTRSICYLLPISMINWATPFMMTALSNVKRSSPQLQLWKTQSKYTTDCEAILKIAGLDFNDKGNNFTEMGNGKSSILVQQ